MYCVKQNFMLWVRIHRIRRGGPVGWERRVGGNRSRAAVTQTSKASWAGAGFFYFFARNPLKSPDSAKEIKGNASVFVWFCLPFLASNSPSGCLQG
jgi:hypothetical protein